MWKSPFTEYIMNKLSFRKKVLEDTIDFYIKKENYKECVKSQKRLDPINKILKEYGKR